MLRNVAFWPARTDYRRGDTVEVRVRVQPGFSAPALRVGLVCTEHYLKTQGEDHPYIAQATEWEEWHDVSTTRVGDTQLFQLRIPTDGAYSHEGKILSISWAVVLRQKRRWWTDPRVAEPIEVRP